MNDTSRRQPEDTPLLPWETVVTRERQRRYHAAAEVPAGLFGDTVDLSILANDTILATRYLKTAAVDGLHAGQRMRQHESVRFDEPLTLVGRVETIRPARKGTFVTYAFDFTRPDGTVPVTGAIVSFQVDPAAMRAGGGGAEAAVDLNGFAAVDEKPMTPEKVMAYSFEFPDYKVHFDPAEAAAVGLRAPIAQGLMSYTWMMQAAAGAGLPAQFTLEAAFRAPIFWDETVDVYRRDGDLLVVKRGGGICSSGRLDRHPG